jgi:hypothetical protein
MSYSTTKQDVLKTLGYFWLRVFKNAEYIDSFTKTLSIHLTDLERVSEELPEYLSRAEIPVFDVQEVHLFQFDEADLLTDAHVFGESGLVYGEPGVTYGQQLVELEEWSYAIDPDLSPAYLAVGLFEDVEIWQRDVDYRVENGRIVFREDPLQQPRIAKVPRQVAGGGTVFEFFMWGFKTERDFQAVKDFYGVIAGVAADSSEVYKEAVNIAWDLRTIGASVGNIKRLLSLASGVDYVDQAGTVEDIFPEGDKICIQTENAVYTAPVETTVLVSIGSQLSVGEIVFDAFAIRQSFEEVDFEDFEALLLDSGFLGLDYDSSLLISNAAVTVSKRHGSGWTYVEHE